MKRLFILTLCLLSINCTKKTSNTAYPDLFQQICELEVRRHGNHPEVPVTEYGSIHLDTYSENPGPEHLLWQAFSRSQDVCRGAYLQLYFDNHRQDLNRRWKKDKDQLSENDRTRIMRLIRSRKTTDLEALVLETLRHDPSTLARHQAGLTLAIFNRKNDTGLREIIRKEQDPEVLSAIALALNIENGSPDLALIQEFGEIQHLPLAQAIISIIATADLDEKKRYLEPLTKSSNQQIADSALAALESLKNQDKLSFTVNDIQPESATKEAEKPVDYQLQKELVAHLLQGEFAAADALIEQGASVHHGSSNWSASLLHQLAYDGHPGAIRWAVSKGADLEVKSSSGKTPLMTATIPAKDWESRLETLIELGADLNATNGIGETALHVAARNGLGPVIRKLIQLGADPHIRDETGRTALNTALLMGYDSLAEIFQDEKKASED